MIDVNHQIIGGEVEPNWIEGDKPQKWLMLTVKTKVKVWDQYSHRASLYTRTRVVVQSPGNVAAIRPNLRPGISVMVIGQGVPAFVCAADKDVRGQVVLADLLQFV